MSGEHDRYTGASRPLWLGLCFFGLVLLAFGVTEYLYATNYEEHGGQARFDKPQDERQFRRSVFRHVTEWGHPRMGKWGCVAIFAVPGAVFLAAGIRLKRRSAV